MSRHFYLTSIVVLLSATSGALLTTASVIGPQWENTIERVDLEFATVSSNRNAFSDEFLQIHQEFIRSEQLPTEQEIEALSEAVRKTLSSLTDAEALSASIRRNKNAYRASIEAILGAINVYDESPEKYLVLHNAFQTEANAGGDLFQSVEVYTAGGIGLCWRLLSNGQS